MDVYKLKNYKDVGLFDVYEFDKRNVKCFWIVLLKVEFVEIFGDINKVFERIYKW